METITKPFDARLKHPFCLLVCGSSMTGKTTFVLNLIDKSEELINPKPNKIIWFYGAETKATSKLRDYDITTVRGIPDSFEKYLSSEKSNHLLVIDDLMTESVNNKKVTELITRQCHHRNASVILLLQDFFYEGTQRKTFLRNAHYLVLFPSPLDMSYIYGIANKIMPGKVKTFLNIFQTATREPYSYLFLDGKPETPPEARLRGDIFKPYQKVFIPN